MSCLTLGSNYNYCIDEIALWPELAKGLGIYFDRNLSFGPQIERMVSSFINNPIKTIAILF